MQKLENLLHILYFSLALYLGFIFAPKSKLGPNHFARESAFKIASMMARLSILKGIL